MAYQLIVGRLNRGGLTIVEDAGDDAAEADMKLHHRLHKFVRQGFKVARNGSNWKAVHPKTRVQLEVYLVEGEAV